MSRASPEQLKGNAQALLLAALEDGPLHGYAIARRIEALTDEYLGLNEGSLYPALHALEHDGAVAAAWESSGGRRRRVYRITRTGRKKLAELREQWLQFASSVNRVLGVALDGEH
jgi:PadR family transcriptional regulator PadR